MVVEVGAGSMQRNESWKRLEDMDFEAIVGRYAGDLLRIAYLLTGSQYEAEDLAHDTLVRARVKWSLVKRSDNPFAYVRRMMLNLLASQRRRNSALPVSGLSLGDRADRVDAIAQVVDRADLRWALVRLSKQERTALVLKYYVQLDTREIAREMGLADSTVRSTLSRGLASLRAVRTDVR